MNPEVNPFAPPPAYDVTQIESQLRTSGGRCGKV